MVQLLATLVVFVAAVDAFSVRERRAASTQLTSDLTYISSHCKLSLPLSSVHLASDCGRRRRAVLFTLLWYRDLTRQQLITLRRGSDLNLPGQCRQLLRR